MGKENCSVHLHTRSTNLKQCAKVQEECVLVDMDCFISVDLPKTHQTQRLEGLALALVHFPVHWQQLATIEVGVYNRRNLFDLTFLSGCWLSQKVQKLGITQIPLTQCTIFLHNPIL